MAQTADMVQAARGLVERARNGDQNAMAIIALVGERARKEKNKIGARVAFGCIQKAISESQMGEDAPPHPDKEELAKALDPATFVESYRNTLPCMHGLSAFIVTLANGPALSLKRLSEYRDATRIDDDTFDADAVGAEKALKKAHGIQVVRMGGPIKAFSREVAWELGE